MKGRSVLSASAASSPEPLRAGRLRRILVTGMAACIGASLVAGLALPGPVLAQASREQRLALLQAGAILPGAQIIAALEATGGQVLDMDLYLPSNQPASWYYRIIFRSAQGVVQTFDVSAVSGTPMTN